jgi:hypothetical protein
MGVADLKSQQGEAAKTGRTKKYIAKAICHSHS